MNNIIELNQKEIESVGGGNWISWIKDNPYKCIIGAGILVVGVAIWLLSPGAVVAIAIADPMPIMVGGGGAIRQILAAGMASRRVLDACEAVDALIANRRRNRH